MTATADPLASPSSAPPRTGLRRAAAVAPVCLTALWTLYSVLNYALSGRWWLWLVFDLVPPVCFLAVPTVLLVLTRWASPRRIRRPLAAVLVLVLLTGLGRAGVNWAALTPGGRPGPVPADALTVVSWNTLYWDTTDDPDAFYRYLKAQRADVYLLQEYLAWDDGRPVPLDELDRVREEFPGYHVAVVGEQLTLSRFPVVSRPPVGQGREIGPGTPWRETFERGKVLRTDVDVRGEVVSFYNVHIPVQLDIERSVLSGGFYREIRARDAERRDHYAQLVKDVRDNPHPVFVAGDFNTTPAMRDLDGLRGTLRDALPASGTVLPGTWNAEGLGLWRLDWAFTDDGLRVHRYAFEDPRGLSDHQAQRLVVSLAR
ncbi:MULTISPECIES: endonuclease/exonuclease/phosphatase family protein [unclassified Streptomyces]|uniref:endonuclease/exonuclease/phosphatase family protein n=1 Tax=unclassified Streptomyces TaxID=2593676 RepID=UPI000F6D1B36|nr:MULTISPECIES: endonuclease/exonuclease/phosphatase family protein [unclassified Streptomyces]AZM59490.1 Tat pathway signal protein [Streptomyces sp. WAC 01438]RSM95730.1 Tat pathway signal protein [Streptomyces sp. WAC 01420]